MSTGTAPGRDASGQVRAAALRPSLHHVNLKTTRLEEMIDWYERVIGAELVFRYPGGAWLTNDGANHRVALLAFPVEDGQQPAGSSPTGLLHTAWEYPLLDDLVSSYRRLASEGILPFMCFDHGMTISIYYYDPDGNAVELQVDVFESWARSTSWMRDSPEFRADPLGVFFDPEQLAGAHDQGLGLSEIHRRAAAGEYLPDPLPDVAMPKSSPAP